MAQEQSTAAQLEWSEPELADNIRRVVRTLQAVRDLGAQELAALVGLERNTWYSRMGSGRESRFTVAEIYRLAHVLDVPASVFFEPAEDLLGGIRKARFLEHPTGAPALRLVRPPSAAA